MSTLYVPTPGWPDINVLDDADAPSAAGIGAATFEALADRVAQFAHAKLIACGSRPFKAAAGRFSVDGDYCGLVTAVASGDYAVLPLHDLVHGAEIDGIDLYFIPKTTARAGWPLGTLPIITLTKWGVSVGAAPSNTLVDTATYVAVSQADYQNGNVKKLSINTIGETVDNDSYVYTLTINDEAGANSIPGAVFVAFAVRYA